MSERDPWLTQLRQLFDEAFSIDWPTHVAELNDRYGLPDDEVLTTHVPESPLWFIGDVEAIQPDAWALAISLNPHTPPRDKYESGHSADYYWNLWRTHNRDYFWYRKFYGPLARVAAASLGEALSQDQEKHFATSRMVFTDLCPYASAKFNRLSKVLPGLVATDIGFQRQAQINRLLIEEARPAVVLVNGVPSMKAMEAVYGPKLRLTEHRYPSESKPTKRLRHLQGVLDLGFTGVPVFGFPFLGGQSTHSANKEIEQLSRHIQQALSGSQSHMRSA